MIGATKEGELQRSVEIFEHICKEKHPYFALAFLYDSQYGRDEIKTMMELMESRLVSERLKSKESSK